MLRQYQVREQAEFVQPCRHIVVVISRMIVAATGAEWKNFLQTVQIIVSPHRNELVIVVQAEQMVNRKSRVLFAERLQQIHRKLEIRLHHHGDFSIFFYSLAGEELQNRMTHMRCALKGNCSATPPFISSWACSISAKIYSFLPSRRLKVSISSRTDFRR